MAFPVAASEAVSSAPQPVISLAPKQGLKFTAAITLFGAGMHYLVSGRKEADLGKMLTGAVLAIASVFIL